MKTANVLLRVLLAFVIGLFVGGFAGLPVIPSGIGVVAFSAIPKPAGLKSGIDVEIWKPWIYNGVFANNAFLNFVRNADDNVVNGKVVHIENAGSASAVERNRKKLPASVTIRTDKDITYNLDEFTSDPRLIRDIDKVLSYDKMESCMGQDMKKIRQDVAEWMFYHWRPETDIDWWVKTTGSNIASHLAGTTGNRKELQLKNLAEAQARMDENDIPAEGRYAVISARMFQQLLSLLTATDYRDFSALADLKKGVVGELYGFKLIKRSTVFRATNASTPVAKSPVTANAVTDNDVILCWQQDYVERAVGEVKIFENLDDATYYGDVYSLLVRAGGRKVTDDDTGVVGIVQTAA